MGHPAIIQFRHDTFSNKRFIFWLKSYSEASVTQTILKNIAELVNLQKVLEKLNLKLDNTT